MSIVINLNKSFLFSIKKSKSSVTCNNINDPFAKLCVLDVVKNINVKVFSLFSQG